MKKKFVILTEGRTNPHRAKTATNVIRYRTDEVVAVLDSTEAGRPIQDLLGVGGSIPVVRSLDEAPPADTLVIGISLPGGEMPRSWRQVILQAIDRGMDVVCGLHTFLSDDPEFASAAARKNVQLIDVRKNNERHIAKREGIREGCLRIHTVGNDCSVGKMVAALEVSRGLNARGVDAKFVATGQTGIMVAGDGIPIDCVVADFVNGAAEQLVLRNQEHDVLVIEGQGSLVQPSFSSVTLGLLHGTMPDGLILCYEVGRTHFTGVEHVPIPPLAEVLRLNEAMANAVHPCRVMGIAMNSRKVSADDADAERERVRDQFGLPVCDVFRHGANELINAVEQLRNLRL